MENLRKNHRIRIIVILLGFLAFHYSSSAKSGFPAVILDNTAADDNWAVITNLGTSTNCNNQDVINDEYCNGIVFRADRGTLQVIQNNQSDELTNFVGINNPDSTSLNNNYTSQNELHLFPLDGSHLFPLEKYRETADDLADITATSLPTGTFGTISFEQFINNVALGTPMYGIVRVEVPLKKNHSGRYRFCGESGCTGFCGPIHGETLEYSKTVCGESITITSKITVYGSLMLDFIDIDTRNAIPLASLDSTRRYWYKIAIPININPANPSVDNTTMETITYAQEVSGSNVCAGSCGSAANTALLNYDNISQESKNEYLYKIGEPLTRSKFDSLPDDEKFNLILPSGYVKGWADAFRELGISNSTWANSYKYRVSPYSSTSTISEADIRSDLFEDIPALISTGGVLSINYHVNISGLIYAPGALEMIQLNKGIPARQYINGSVIAKRGFYIEAIGDNGSITFISNNPDNYAKIEVSPKSPVYGKISLFSHESAPSEVLSSLSGSASVTADTNGNLPAPDIFSSVVNAANTPGRQWTEIKPQ